MLTLLCWASLFGALFPPVRLAEDRQAQAAVIILRGDPSGALLDSPGRHVVMRVHGSTAWLHDARTGIRLEGRLSHASSLIQVNPPAELRITCWAFSPDGRFVATGAGYKRVIDGEVQENEGEVRVWEVATGRLVGTERRGLGQVLRVAFSRDSKVVLFDAEPFEIDGK